jgi:anaerobic ribonucleoside-triphosphate reductase
MSPIIIKRQECIVYSRVVGWLTPVKNWNKGKKAEFTDRKTFDVDEKAY